MKEYLIENRSNSKRRENKLGPHKPGVGMSKTEQDTMPYRAVNLYNSIPSELTLIKKHNLFKKKLKKYYLEKKIDIKNKDINYNENEDIKIPVSKNLIIICQNLSQINLPPEIKGPPGPPNC